jgi:SPP1 family phage portal protein
MTTEIIIASIESGEIDKLKSTLEVSKYAYFISDSFKNNVPFQKTDENMHVKDAKEYNPKQHEVFSPSKRKDKIINDEDGKQKDVVKVSRIPLPVQKRIVKIAAAFLGSPEIVSTPGTDIEKTMYNALKLVSDDNKLSYKFKEILKRTMSERECAELWYTEEVQPDHWKGTVLEGAKFKLRMRILSPILGDVLYPVFDKTGDMIAFGRYYETVEQIGSDTSSQNNKVCYFDLYTKDTLYFMKKDSSNEKWVPVVDVKKDETASADVAVPTGIPNVIGEIPVIYYSKPVTEWQDVQEMIERLETKISNHADTNDYFDSPIVKLKGTVKGFSEKGEQGKLLEMENGADAEYLTWDQAPESTKMEIENLLKFINQFTSTPDISFDNIKSIGTFSGIAIKMFFMDAHLKASDNEELFGMCVQRRLNYLKGALSTISLKLKPAIWLKVTPKFTYFMPKDVDGEVSTLVKAVEAGIISKKTAVRLNPLVDNYENEISLIEAQGSAKPPTAPTA